MVDGVTVRDESVGQSASVHDVPNPVPTAVVETPATRGFVGWATGELRRLPWTARFGLAVLGLFGFADVVAHVGVPVTAGGSASDRQLLAHLGVLAGMVVVLGGVLRDTRPRATSRRARRSDEGNPAPKAPHGQSRAVGATAAGPADGADEGPRGLGRRPQRSTVIGSRRKSRDAGSDPGSHGSL